MSQGALRVNVITGNVKRRGRLSTVELHVPTSLDQLHLILKTLFAFLQKKNEEANGTEPFPFS